MRPRDGDVVRNVHNNNEAVIIIRDGRANVIWGQGEPEKGTTTIQNTYYELETVDKFLAEGDWEIVDNLFDYERF